MSEKIKPTEKRVYSLGFTQSMGRHVITIKPMHEDKFAVRAIETDENTWQQLADVFTKQIDLPGDEIVLLLVK